MLTTVEGVFRNGHVELRETPANIEEARVIVTFLEPATREAGLPPRTAWERLTKEDPFPETPNERLHAFQELLASLPEAPVIPLESMDRGDLYR